MTMMVLAQCLDHVCSHDLPLTPSVTLDDNTEEQHSKRDIDESGSLIDATFARARGGDEIGPSKRRKGEKIMSIVDHQELPLSVSANAPNHHEVTLVQLSFDFYMIEARTENLIGDREYGGDPLDEELRRQKQR